ncbi:hypothetical protein V7D15_07370 [Thermoanaerobacter thermohydrosulfuricus]
METKNEKNLLAEEDAKEFWNYIMISLAYVMKKGKMSDVEKLISKIIKAVGIDNPNKEVDRDAYEAALIFLLLDGFNTFKIIEEYKQEYKASLSKDKDN